MEATPGDVVDQEFVKKAILEDGAFFKVEKFGFDPWNATKLSLELQDEGVPITGDAPGHPDPGRTVEGIRTAGLRRPLDHGGIRSCAGWSGTSRPLRFERQLQAGQAKSSEKIDGVVGSLVMALGLAIANDNEKSVYEKRGIRRL
jgi:hypothetical protein